jgi:flagellar motor protein MotB
MTALYRGRICNFSLLSSATRVTLIIISLFLLISTSRASNDESVAVIIGNRTYGEGVPAVAFAHNDADAMKRFIIGTLGYREGNIIDLRDASQAQLIAAFGNERSHQGTVWQWVRPGESDVVVFYSGHGVPGLKDHRGYLLPVDADPNRPELNGYPVDLLYSNLAKIEARSVTVLLDACFSGDSPKGMLIRATSGITVTPKLPEKREGLTILTAARGDQMASWDEAAKHGLFTRYLLEALHGSADAGRYGNGDGEITVSEVRKYLDREMTYAARRRFGREQNAGVVAPDGVVLVSAADLGNREVDDDTDPIVSLSALPPGPYVPRRRVEAFVRHFEELQVELERLHADLTRFNAEREALKLEIEGTRAALSQLESDNQALTGELGNLRAEGPREELEARLREAEKKRHLLGKQLDARDIRLEELTANYNLSSEQLTEEQRISAAARQQVTLLNRQLLAIREQITSLQQALDASEAEAEARNDQVFDLGKRLNRALASKVQELARFRSEFFGRLREVLKNRKDIRVVGDRFVFQSEVLFESGAADIATDGESELRRLAAALNEITPKIPESINWILQIEGHTDTIPIYTDRFRSNWDLSAGRAISVVKFLIDQGVPADRLAATGYGEFQPIDSGGDVIGNRRNRRIEMKLTQR